MDVRDRRRSANRPLGRLAFLPLLLAACGSSAPTGPEPVARRFELPADPAAFFLIVDVGPGYWFVEHLVRPPRHALTVEGDLFSERLATAWPAPILPDIRRRRLSPGELRQVLEAAGETALPVAEDGTVIPEPTGRLADAGTTSFTLNAASGERTVHVEGLTIARHTDPRAPALLDLYELLERLAQQGESERFTGERVEVFVLDDSGPPETEADAREWPFPELPPAPPADRGCDTFGGETAASVLAALEEESNSARWNYEGKWYQILARPLLPGEGGCGVF